MFEAKEVCVRIGDKSLVDQVSLTVAPGHLLAVVGANGAGKSTLLRVLSGESHADAGQIHLNGRPLSGWTQRDQARVRAVLPQRSTLNFAFGVLDVVLMGRTPHVDSVEQPQDYAIAHEALAAVGMTSFAGRLYTTLSGGEQQRVQLARALVQVWEESPLGARYLLLDEPTNNLDLAHQHRTLQIARTFTERGVGVLAILHDLNLAAQYADTVLMMKAGQALAYGSPQETLTPALIEDAFAVSVMVMPHPCHNCPLIVSGVHM
ncbi:heme ABC transporter ATP-binding protein [bacterium]|nr:heme ABC transporter ATP-binding protein [bacterium]